MPSYWIKRYKLRFKEKKTTNKNPSKTERKKSPSSLNSLLQGSSSSFKYDALRKGMERTYKHNSSRLDYSNRWLILNPFIFLLCLYVERIHNFSLYKNYFSVFYTCCLINSLAVLQTKTNKKNPKTVMQLHAYLSHYLHPLIGIIFIF